MRFRGVDDLILRPVDRQHMNDVMERHIQRTVRRLRTRAATRHISRCVRRFITSWHFTL